MSHEPTWCPTFQPSRQDFARPFVDFVAEVFERNPDLPMFKVTPPPGWRARRTKFPDLKDVMINTPIRQHVFGSKGVYRCVFVEHKPMTVEEFKRQALDESQATGPALQKKIKESTSAVEGDAVMERAFWSSVTLNPPLYGADTPASFFDSKIPYGWNLRDLGDLLKTHDVPDIPGVTTPMTYFGCWRSFFGWHKEDADLLSINYLHFGEPKMWYCVSPKDQAKFDRMAQSTFPELHRACKSFIRHKDVMMSPSHLRTHNIPFMQAKQMEGEFIVLNASAYHSGFNLGFNCAEAINFATPAWVDVGKAALPCHCKQDTVHISMKLFDPEWSEDDSDSEEEEEEEEEAEGDEEEEEEGSARSSRKRAASAAASAPAKRRRSGSRSGVRRSGASRSGTRTSGARASGASRSGVRRSGSSSGASRSGVRSSGASRSGTRRSGSRSGSRSGTRVASATPARRRVGAGDAPQARARVTRDAAEMPAEVAQAATAAATAAGAAAVPSAGRFARPGRGERVTGPTAELRREGQASPRGGGAGASSRLVSRGSRASEEEGDAAAMADDEPVGQPLAIVGEDSRGVKFFCLVQRLRRPASTKGMAVLRWLREGPDGLYRPVPSYWEERPEALIGVRTQYLPEGLRKRVVRGEPEAQAQAQAADDAPPSPRPRRTARAPGAGPAAAGGDENGGSGSGALGAGWKLLTLKSRIMETEMLSANEA